MAVLPSRCYAAAFSGLGCLLAGAAEYQGALSWQRFKAFPVGKEVYWRTPTDNTRYGGTVVETTGPYPDLVTVRITVGRKKDIGTTWGFSRAKFTDCLFSESVLPTEQRASAIDDARRIFRELGAEPSSHWLWTAGTEALIVTNQAKFGKDARNLRIGLSGSAGIRLDDAILVGAHSDKASAKLRLISPNKVTEHEAPLFILDGAGGWGLLDALHGGNVLAVLSRSEYTPEMNDFLLDARSSSICPSHEFLSDIPERFPPEVEIAGFLLPAD